MSFLTEAHPRNRHWRFLYRHRRRSANASTKQIIAGQIFTVIVSIGAGLWLDSLKHSIIAVAGAFILMPGIVDLSASLAGALGAKVNHHLEEGDKSFVRVFAGSVSYGLLVAVLAGGLVGAVGGLIGVTLFDADFVVMLKLMLISMFLVGIIIYPVVAVLVVVIRHFEWNPDNLVGPIQSSLVDILAVVVIATVAGWVT